MNHSTPKSTLRDRLWLWGMRPNALQQSETFQRLGFAPSTLTVEQVIARTGIGNVYMAGGLEIDEQSLASMPSARRIVCKWSIHRGQPPHFTLDFDGAAQRLAAAKRLASADPRVEAFNLDDFSTGAMDAGVSGDHLARLQFLNAASAHPLPLYATIYSMSLERPGLPEVMRYFDHFLVPLWHVPEIDGIPKRLDRCAELSGGKPMTLCLYLYDFGNHRTLGRVEMQRQLDVACPLLEERKITGLLFCGTCMMDQSWESVSLFYEWVQHIDD